MAKALQKITVFLSFGSFASLLDLHGTYRPPVNIPDAAAMRADWNSVGDDLRVAMKESIRLIPGELERVEVAELVEQ